MYQEKEKEKEGFKRAPSLSHLLSVYGVSITREVLRVLGRERAREKRDKERTSSRNGLSSAEARGRDDLMQEEHDAQDAV